MRIVRSANWLVVIALCFIAGALSLGITGCEKQTSRGGKPGTKLVRWCTGGPYGYCESWIEMDLADPAPPGPNPPYSAIALRQSDCSLTRYILDATFAVQTAFTIPKYEEQLHELSGLSTTRDVFKNGCKDPTTGIASQLGANIGPFSNGNSVLVGLGNSVLTLTLVNSTTGAIQSMQNVTIIPSTATGASTFGLSVADLNGDGIQDIVIASSGFSGANPGEITVLLGTGNGAFGAPVNIPVVAPATGVTIDDMNGDGKLDLVVIGLTLFNGGTGLEILPGNGDGTFGTPILAANGIQGLVAATADFNNDGKKDIATSTGQILLGDGTGKFTLQPATLPTLTPTGGNPNTVTGVAAADFNHDGNIDLAVTNAVALTVDLYFGNGNGTFTYQESYPSLIAQQNILTTDIDGDGNTDLFVGIASNGAFGPDFNTEGLFMSLLNNGTGKMAAAHAYLPSQPALQFPVLYDVADFTGDKKPDLLTVGEDSTSTNVFVSVLSGNGDGTFGKVINTPITIAGLAQAQGNLNALIGGDFDGDGKIDAAFAYNDQSGNHRVSVALGNGDGTFKQQVDFTLPAYVGTMIPVDLNGDGLPDLAFIANPSTTSSTTTTQLYTMLNQSTVGNPSFAAPQLADSEPNLAFLAAQDLNADKHQDLVATTSNVVTPAPGSVFVYLGKGDGTFQASTSYQAGTYPGPVTTADLNGDGNLDILVASTNSDTTTGTLITLPGKGDGTFGAAINTAIASGSGSSIAVVPANASGNQQAVVGTCCGDVATQEAVSNGDGTFAPLGDQSGYLPLGFSSTFVKVVDINGDQLPDLLLVSNQYAIEAFLNASGTSTATNATSTTLTSSAQTITAGQSVTLTATVTPASGTATPTGTVTFLDGATTLGTGTLNSSGVATLGTTALAAGANSITAVYSGDANFSGSTSTAVTITVSTVVATATTLSASAATAVSGASLTFTATVSPASGSNAPTGIVTFLDGTTTLGTGALSAGSATLSTATLSTGAHSITASYGGSNAFAPSTSAAISVTITAVSPGFALALSPSSGTVSSGGNTTSTITITPAGGFNQAVALTCSGAPQNASCSINPASVTPSSGSTAPTATLTIATNVATANFSGPPSPGYSDTPGGGTALALLGGGVIWGFSLLRRRYQNPSSMRLEFVLAVLITSVFTGCGGGHAGGSGGSSTSTPAGTYTITVTATSGAISKTTTYGLTVQ